MFKNYITLFNIDGNSNLLCNFLNAFIEKNIYSPHSLKRFRILMIHSLKKIENA